jgi:hypothetical protein
LHNFIRHSAIRSIGSPGSRLFGGITSVDSLIVDTDGTVTVANTVDLRHHRLPGVVVAGIFRSSEDAAQGDLKWSPGTRENQLGGAGRTGFGPCRGVADTDARNGSHSL